MSSKRVRFILCMLCGMFLLDCHFFHYCVVFQYNFISKSIDWSSFFLFSISIVVLFYSRIFQYYFSCARCSTRVHVHVHNFVLLCITDKTDCDVIGTRLNMIFVPYHFYLLLASIFIFKQCVSNNNLTLLLVHFYRQ